MSSEPPAHHKEIAVLLRDRVSDDARVTAYRNNQGKNPIPIGQFGKHFFSTIGVSDKALPIPAGSFEFAAIGKASWLPNAIASSIYWLRDRECDDWPLVCEDVVRHNAKSTYRHMAFVPSDYCHRLSNGSEVRWLLGIPLSDAEIGISKDSLNGKAKKQYPGWLFEEGT